MFPGTGALLATMCIYMFTMGIYMPTVRVYMVLSALTIYSLAVLELTV